MYGFSDLPRSKTLEILNLRRNLMGLGGRSNASKGANSWTAWRGHRRLGPVPRSLRQQMVEEEESIRILLHESIRKALLE